MSLTPITLETSITRYREELRSRAGIADSTLQARVGSGSSDKRSKPLSGYIGFLVREAGPQTLTTRLDRSHVSALFALYRDKPGTYNACYVAVGDYLRFLVAGKYISRSRADELMEGRSSVPYKRGKMLYLTIDQYDKALEIAGGIHPQRRIIIALAGGTGLRQIEIRSVKLGGLRRADQELDVWRAKQKEWFTAPVHGNLDREIYEIWLPFYAAEAGYETWREMVKDHPEWPLIPRFRPSGRTGRMVLDLGHPYMSSIGAVAKEILGRLDLDWHRDDSEDSLEGQAMHVFRRSMARILFKVWSKDGGGNQALIRVQMWLGHKDLKTTARYIGLDQEKEEMMDLFKSGDPFDIARQSAAEMAPPANVVSLSARRARKEHMARS